LPNWRSISFPRRIPFLGVSQLVSYLVTCHFYVSYSVLLFMSVLCKVVATLGYVSVLGWKRIGSEGTIVVTSSLKIGTAWHFLFMCMDAYFHCTSILKLGRIKLVFLHFNNILQLSFFFVKNLVDWTQSIITAQQNYFSINVYNLTTSFGENTRLFRLPYIPYVNNAW